MFNTVIKFSWPFLFLIFSIAYAGNENIPQSPPRGYVAVCKSGNKTTIEPYEIHEARVTHGWVPFIPNASSVNEVIEETASRLAPFSLLHSLNIENNVGNVLDKAKFLGGVDIVLDEGEKLPPALKNGCEVKKLYTFQPPQLPYDFVFDSNLWNALSNTGKAVAMVNIALSLPCTTYSCDSLSGMDPANIRRFTSLVFSSVMPKMTAREWFTELKTTGIYAVIYKRFPIRVYDAEFFDQTGTIKKANAGEFAKVEILHKHLYLDGPIEFYANGTIHTFTPSNSHTGLDRKEDAFEILGGRGLLSGDCKAEISEEQKLVQACFENWTKVKTDRYFLTVSGHMSFHPSGYVETASGEGLVELNGKIVEVTSDKWRDNLSFDAAGNIMTGTLASRTKFRDINSNSEFELEASPFTAYPSGRIKSGYLAKDAKLKDCTGAVRLFLAGSEIHFNEAGVVCGSPK